MADTNKQLVQQVGQQVSFYGYYFSCFVGSDAFQPCMGLCACPYLVSSSVLYSLCSKPYSIWDVCLFLRCNGCRESWHMQDRLRLSPPFPFPFPLSSPVVALSRATVLQNTCGTPYPVLCLARPHCIQALVVESNM